MAWWLNDTPPKFGAELAECQRKQVVYGSKQRFFGICSIDNNSIGQGILFTPVKLDKVPTIAQGSLHAYNGVNNIDIDGFSVVGVGPTGVWLTVHFATTPDLSGGRIILIYSVADIVIDAND